MAFGPRLGPDQDHWKSGISQARSRLGSAPLEHLYRSCVQPIAATDTQGAWYQDRRLVSLDSSTLDLPDEVANRRHFGGPGTYNGPSSFPQLRFATLAEIGTHVLFGAEMDNYRTSEVALAKRVVERLEPGLLCLADRGFFGFDLWQQAQAKGADLLWRAPKTAALPVDTALPDGSYLSQLTKSRRRALKNPPPGLPVRVVEYRIEGVDKEPIIYRLVTTLLDHERTSAIDLAKLYQQRWEIETAFDELKTHLRGPRLCLRSKTPDLVRQEFFGLLLAHFAVRGLMHEAARDANEDPDKLSFVHSLNVIRRKASLAISLSPST